MPKFLIFRPIDDKNKVSVQDQKLLWSGIGMMLCLVKCSRSNVANATWKVSEVNDRTREASFL